MKKDNLPNPGDFTQVAETQSTDGCRSCWFFVNGRCCGQIKSLIKLRDEVEKNLGTDCGEDNVHYKLRINGTNN